MEGNFEDNTNTKHHIPRTRSVLKILLFVVLIVNAQACLVNFGRCSHGRFGQTTREQFDRGKDKVFIVLQRTAEASKATMKSSSLFYFPSPNLVSFLGELDSLTSNAFTILSSTSSQSSSASSRSLSLASKAAKEAQIIAENEIASSSTTTAKQGTVSEYLLTVTNSAKASYTLLGVTLYATLPFSIKSLSPMTGRSPFSWTMTTLLSGLALTMMHGSRSAQAAANYAIPPADQKTLDILASNLTVEEKFKQVLLQNHRRYCDASTTCLGQSLKFQSCQTCQPCQCDDECDKYGDCCPDKLADDHEEVPRLTLQGSCRDNLYAGYSEAQRQPRLSNSTTYRMVDSCPSGASQDLVIGCRDPRQFHPLSLKWADEGRQTRTRPELVVGVFANHYCAQCHGVDQKELVSWTVLVACEDHKNFSSTAAEDVAMEASRLDSCFITYLPKPSHPPPRVCYYDDSFVTSCNVTGAWRPDEYDFTWPGQKEFLQRACASYMSTKVVNGVTYQNVYCYMCNTGQWNSQEMYGKICPRSLRPMPFSALLDFSDAIFGISRVVHKQCDDDTVYDDSINECRKVLCAPGRVFTENVCYPIFSNALGLGYTLYLSITLDREVNLYDENDFLHVLPGILEYTIVKKGTSDFVKPTEFELSFEITDVEGRCSQKTRLISMFCRVVVNSFLTSQDSIENTLLSLRNLSISTRGLNFTTHVDESVWMQQTRALGPAGPTVASGENRACSTKVSNYPQPSPGGSPTVFTRVHHLMTRPKVELQNHEFTIKAEDYSLQVPWLLETIPIEKYESTAEGKYYISLEDFMPKLKEEGATSDEPDEAEVILSMLCTSVSLVCLALTFLTYIVFRQLRTAPGKNNINLCLTLFLAQLFYLVGSGKTEEPGLCRAMGILIHYFWLAAFASMTVCTYHMWRAFTCVTAANDDADDQRRRFMMYTVYIWGASAAIVVVYLLTNLVISEGHSIGYGGAACYLSSALAVGVAMGIPVALTVTSSVTFFSLTVRTIRRSPKPTKSKEDEQHVWVYFKLSTLTGATWALTFIVFFTEVMALRYLFTVVNALQGVFIFISFVCNRRVFKLLHAGCCSFRGFKGLPSGLTSGSGSRTGSSTRSTETGTTGLASRRSQSPVTNGVDIATIRNNS